jgi:Tfp pilus assembly protein PilN
MFSPKTALGIDISDGRISLALLRQNAKGIELIKAANGPVPDGAIKDGNVEDSVKLYHAIKELRARNKIRGINRTGVSLLTKPVILQILDIPKGVPTNIGRFVRNEAKNCVALSGKEIAFDFCRIKSGQDQGSRLLAVATDGQKVAELADACSRAGLNAEVIEPALLAYVRAIHVKKIEGRFDCDVLIAVLRDGVLSLCVFRKQSLDFVGARNISREKAEPEELGRWLAEEINSIIRFYDVEAADRCGKWEVTVVSDSMPLPDDAEQSLRAKIIVDSLQVRTGEDAFKDTLVVQNKGLEKPSVVALGLAMKLLNINGISLKINLLPPESTEVKSLKKHLLITANIIAAVLLLMILVAGGLSRMANNMKQKIILKKQTELSQNTYNLLGEQELLDKQIRQLSDRPARLKSILSARYAVDWARILEDVRNRTPKTVRITNLYSTGNTRIYLEGEALSYEVVHLFVKMLNSSEYISSASLAETVKEEKTGGLVVYSINCFLNREKKES